MKKIILIFTMLLFTYSARAIEFKVEKVIEINNNLNYNGLLDKSIYDSHVEILYNNNKIAGRFIAVEFKNFVNKFCDINEANRSKLLIRCTSENGENNIYSYSQIDGDVSALPVYLVIKEIHGTIGDTVVVGFDKQEKMQTAKIDEETDKAIDTKVKLLFTSKTDKIKPDYLKSGSLLFLSNRSTRYWMTKLKKIEILSPIE